mgnify:CR=1 FL=1
MLQSFCRLLGMVTLWRRERVTVYQGNKIVAIGTMIVVVGDFITLGQVLTMRGQIKPRRMCAFRCNRVDRFANYEPGDEELLPEPKDISFSAARSAELVGVGARDDEGVEEGDSI